MRQSALLLLAALPLIGLGACTSATSPRQQVAVLTPPTASVVDTALAGQWRSGDGIAVSTFNNGVFQSALVATGEIVVNGRYVPAGPGQYKIDWFSQKAKANTSATCSLTGAGKLFCTQDGGNTFELTRAA